MHLCQKLGIILKAKKNTEEWEQIPLLISIIKKGGNMASIEEKVEKLLQPKIEEIGYELYDVEYSKEGKNYYLRIYIDKNEGIDLNDCEIVSSQITDILDQADYIKEQYYLEVSSPGIERNIRKEKHLKQNIGKEIAIKLFKKDSNGKKEYKGILKKYNEQFITLENEQEEQIERKNIAQIKTIYNW